MANSKKANYILKTVGITLPDYKRENLKVGMSVELEEKVGDKFASRGFLVKAGEAKPNTTIEKLKDENAALTKDNEALTEKVAALTKDNEALKKAK